MHVRRLHSWKVTPREAVAIQGQLRAKVITQGRVGRPKLVAGADAAFDKDLDVVYASVAVLAFPSLEEAPVLLRAFLKLKHEPDVIFIDGRRAPFTRKSFPRLGTQAGDQD